MRSPVDPVIMMSTASPVVWSEPVPGRRPPKVLTSGNAAHTARKPLTALGSRPDSIDEDTSHGGAEVSLEVPSPSEDFSSVEDFSSLLDEPSSLWLDWAEDSAVGSGFGVLTSSVVFDDLYLYFESSLTLSRYFSLSFLRWASIWAWLTADGLVDSSVVVVAASVVTLPDSGGPMTTVEPTTAAVAAAGTAIAATTGRCLTVASTEVAVDGTFAECRPAERFDGVRSRTSCFANDGFGEECLPNAELP